jgi:SOUL heme-binding protein
VQGGTETLAEDAAGQVVMSFVMPSKYSQDTLPRPNNADVSVRTVPAHTAAALTFRGHIRDRSVVELRKKQLLQLITDEGLVPVGGVKLYQYHPPFTYGWQRVNEVLYEVKPKA